jgi:hypothetical protein
VLWLHYNELQQGTSSLKNFSAILEAFDILVIYCFSTKLKILNHKKWFILFEKLLQCHGYSKFTNYSTIS